MNETLETGRNSRHRLLTAAWLAACLAGALLLVHHPMLLSRLTLMPTNPGDTRFVNYLLEHSYQWLQQAKHHEQFWSPPFFYPERNAAAYSDMVLGIAPLYLPWRMSGLAHDTSLQLCLLAITTVNFLAAYFFLRRAFQITPLAAGLAAVFFAGGNSLVAQIGHIQLFCLVYVIGAFYAVLKMFPPSQSPPNTPSRNWFLVALFSACLVLQLHTNFYFGFFILLVLGVATLYTLMRAEGRRQIAGFCQTNLPQLVVCGALAGVAMIPWLTHYLPTARHLGFPSTREIATMIPRPQSWINMGPDNWLYGWTAGWKLFRELPMEHEHRLGLGLATTTMFITGLVICRHRWGMRTIMVTTLLLLPLVTQLGLGLPPAWELVCAIIPGAKAARSVSRIGMLLLIPAAMGLGFLLHFFFSKQKPAFFCAGGLIAALCLLEQFSLTPGYDKEVILDGTARIVREIQPDCTMFLYTCNEPSTTPYWQVQLDAMWAGLIAGKPTINGYSGKLPKDWDFIVQPTETDPTQERINTALDVWCKKFGLNRRDVQWIRR